MRVLRTAGEATSCQQALQRYDGKRRTFGLEGCRLEIMSGCSRDSDSANSLSVAITMRTLSYHVPRQTATARDVILFCRGHGHFSAAANTTQSRPNIHQHERNNTHLSTCAERKRCSLQPRDAQAYILHVDSIPRRLSSKSPMAHSTASTLLQRTITRLQIPHCSRT